MEGNGTWGMGTNDTEDVGEMGTMGTDGTSNMGKMGKIDIIDIMGTNGTTMGNWTQVDDDELEDPKEEEEEKKTAEECKNADCKPFPATQALKIQIMYTKGLAEKLGSKKKAMKAINTVMTHVQAYYCHNSLGSKIKIQVGFLILKLCQSDLTVCFFVIAGHKKAKIF